MAFGVTTTGFNRKRLDDIKSELEKDFQGVFGKEVNLNPEEVLGQLVGIISEREALLWELANNVYDSQYPDTSFDIPLDNVSSIVGVTRQGSTSSVVIGQLFFGTIGTVIDTTKSISVLNNLNAKFILLSSITLVAGLNEIQKLTFGNDPDSGLFNIEFRTKTIAINHDDSISAINTKLDAELGVGNVVASGAIDDITGLSLEFKNPGPNGLGLRSIEPIVIGTNTLQLGATPTTVAISETQAGVPQGQTDVQAEVVGPTDAPAFSLTEIDTPVSGWDSTVNEEDATLGVNVETDPDYKIRRRQEVAKPGQATPPGIFSDLIDILGVTAVIVFQNNNDIVDLDGRPPHSVDIVVEGGDEDIVADEVFKTVGAGPTFVGDITKVVKDSNDFDQTIKFSRPTPVEIHVEIDLTIDTDIFPVNGLAQVEAAILAYGNSLTISQNVIVFGSDPSLSCSIQDVPGILDYTVRVGKTAGPATDDNVTIEPREISDFDSSRITAITI